MHSTRTFFLYFKAFKQTKNIIAVHNYPKDANHSAKLPKLDIKYID